MATHSLRSKHSTGDAERHAALLREFAQTWRSNARPSIRSFLERVSDADKLTLLRELLLEDWRLRTVTGETPCAADYITALPEFADQVHQIAADIPTMSFRPVSPGDASASTLLGIGDNSRPARANIEQAAAGQPALIGSYEIIKEIGHGGMGIVYRARHQVLGRMAAIKLLHSGTRAEQEEVARFAAEAKAAAQLDHPCIVPLYEVGEHEGQHFLALAFVEGESLARRVQSRPLEPHDAARVMELVAQAVQYSHERGVIHRDLKPANILMTADDQPKVTDFGLAKLLFQDAELTQTGQILGTPAYMPPEQASQDSSEVGPLADVYSLGATLYCLLTGRPPFQAARALDTLKQVIELEPVAPRALNAAIPVDLETICLRCLRKEPNDRYPSASALADDLQRFQTGRPILARPVTISERAWRWCRREPMKAGLALTACVSLFAGVMASSLFAWRASDRADVAEAALGREKTALIQAREGATAAKLAGDEARSQAERNAQLLYVADMQYIQQAWERGELPEIRTRLARHLPKPNEPDRRNFEWHYWQRVTSRAEPILFLDANNRPIKPSPPAILLDDSRTLIGIQEYRNLVVWSVHSRGGQDIAEFQREFYRNPETWFQREFYKHQDTITAMRLSPNGRLLAIGDTEGTVKLWSIPDLAEVAMFSTEPRCQVKELAFDPQSARLAMLRATSRRSGNEEPFAIRIWDLASQQKLYDVPVSVEAWHTSVGGTSVIKKQLHDIPQVASSQGISLHSVEFAEKRDWLLLSGGVYALIWDLKEEEVVHRFELPVTPTVQSTFRFAEQGHTVVGLGSRDELFVWDANLGTRRAVLNAPGTANARAQTLAVSPDGLRVAVGQDDRLTTIWDVQQGTLLETRRGVLLPEDPSRGRTWRTGEHYTNRGDFWGAENQRPDVKVVDLGTRVNVLALDQVSETLAVDTDKEHVCLKPRVSDASLNPLIPRGPADEFSVRRVKFDPKGRYLAIAFDDGRVEVFDTAQRTKLPHDLRTQNTCHDIAFIPQTTLFAVSGGAGEIWLWDLTSGREVGKFLGHTTLKNRELEDWNKKHPNSKVALQPVLPSDLATSLVQASTFGVRTVKVPYAPEFTGAVYALSAHPSGEHLASVGGDGTLRVWDVRDQREIWRTTCKRGSLFQCVQYDPQGRYLAAGGSGSIFLWSADSHESLAEWSGHEGDVRHLVFSHDGSRLASSSIDGTVRLWDVETGLAVLRLDLPRRSIQRDSIAEISFDPTGLQLMTAEVRRWQTLDPPKTGLNSHVWLWDAREAADEIGLTDGSRRGESAGSVKLAKQSSTATDSLEKVPEAAESRCGLAFRFVRNGTVRLRLAYSATITRPYYLSETEVTVGQFRQFVEETGHMTDAERLGGDLRIPKGTQRKSKEFTWKTPGFPQTDDHPVVQVSWNDAQAFCNWLTRTEGVKHRLPTEAEWEWACRAGSETKFCFGDDANPLPAYGWCLLNSDGLGTRPVGQLKPNPWGLYDMYGNVCEWVHDFHGDHPSSGTVIDPQGPTTHPQTMHVARGGAFDSNVEGCSPRSYGWSWYGGEDFAVYHFGFRVLREIPMHGDESKSQLE
uniref:non-specific serine/threonine protein kinase n=1 Tax=Schlesneria paludicola TaxID=360056 RepID=A0A7C2JZ55_9PLAN